MLNQTGGFGTSSGGNRDYVPGLCRAGAGLGIRNFFLEVHNQSIMSQVMVPNAL